MRYEDLPKTSRLLRDLAFKYENWLDVPFNYREDVLTAFYNESSDAVEVLSNLDVDVVGKAMETGFDPIEYRALMREQLLKAIDCHFETTLQKMFDYCAPCPFEREQELREQAKLQREDSALVKAADAREKLIAFSPFIQAERVRKALFPQLKTQGA